MHSSYPTSRLRGATDTGSWELHVLRRAPPRPSPPSTATVAAAAALLLLLPLLLLPFEPPHGRFKRKEHDGGARHHPQQMGAHARVQTTAPFLHRDEPQAGKHGVIPGPHAGYWWLFPHPRAHRLVTGRRSKQTGHPEPGEGEAGHANMGWVAERWYRYG